MKIIDLRSDTVTKPSLKMREFMMKAQVGDDVYGEDPTINALQEKAARITGKEAALFVPSGSMANQITIKALTEMGDEVLIGRSAHCYLYESGAGPAFSGIQFTQIGTGGIFDASDVECAIKEDNHHYTPTKLICCENTHNRGGGIIFPIENIRRIKTFAQAKGLKMHLDGARIFNASIVTGISVKEYSKYFDTLSFCLSKGLGAPVGSLICSDRKLIEGRAHRYRKMLGGAMRQAGILASAGIYALENNVERLKDDHDNAKLLAESISSNDIFAIDVRDVQTNIVIFSLSENASKKTTAAAVCDSFKKKGILFSPISSHSMRIVTHLDVNRQDVEYAAKELKGFGG